MALRLAALTVVLAGGPATAQSIYDNYEADETGRAWRDYYAKYPPCRSVIEREWATDDLVTATNEERRLASTQQEKDALDEQREMLVNLRGWLDDRVKTCARREDALAVEERARSVRTEAPQGQVADGSRRPAAGNQAPSAASLIPADPARSPMTANEIIDRARRAQVSARMAADQQSFGALVDMVMRGPGAAFEYFKKH
jgi:hypothetical protein